MVQTESISMKKRISIFVVLLLLTSCSRNDLDFDCLEYSYGGTFSTAFSIKFTQSDTLFLREHWNAIERSDGIKFPKAKTNYYAIMSRVQRNQLREILDKINFRKLNTAYFEDYSDGSSYQIIIKKEALNKTVYVHSLSGVPKELDSLSSWIYNMKENIDLIESNKKLCFDGINRTLPPPPPTMAKAIHTME